MTTRPLLLASAFAVVASIAACGSMPNQEPVGPLAKEEVVAVNTAHELLRFNAGQPQKTRDTRRLSGLRDGERLVGIDYRVARGELYALGASGQLYRIDVAKAAATPIGAAPAALPAETASAREWSFDFNPTVDRIRIATEGGFNGRLHPDSGAAVDANPDQPGLQFDGRLAYDASDAHAGKAARIVAAGYTYNKGNDRITTNYALDGALGTLVHQGSKEGAAPMVSPNTGRLHTVGSLGIGAFEHATFDISDVSNAAYAGVRAAAAKATRWHRIDLATGKATFIGTVGGGAPLVGAAIEP